MTPNDAAFLEILLDRGLIRGRVVEIGSREVGAPHNTRNAVTRRGHQWEGADVESGPGVDWVLDLSDASSVEALGRTWDSVLLFNVLEHVYDPTNALRNALRLVAAGAHLAIITPTVWQIHDWPGDYWRPLPDFYIEFARQNKLDIFDEAFCWLYGDGKMTPVSEMVADCQKLLPSREPNGAKLYGSTRLLYSRIVHRALGTIGRDLYYPWSALGVVFRCP